MMSINMNFSCICFLMLQLVLSIFVTVNAYTTVTQTEVFLPQVSVTKPVKFGTKLIIANKTIKSKENQLFNTTPFNPQNIDYVQSKISSTTLIPKITKGKKLLTDKIIGIHDKRKTRKLIDKLSTTTSINNSIILTSRDIHSLKSNISKGHQSNIQVINQQVEQQQQEQQMQFQQLKPKTSISHKNYKLDQTSTISSQKQINTTPFNSIQSATTNTLKSRTATTIKTISAKPNYYISLSTMLKTLQESSSKSLLLSSRNSNNHINNDQNTNNNNVKILSSSVFKQSPIVPIIETNTVTSNDQISRPNQQHEPINIRKTMPTPNTTRTTSIVTISNKTRQEDKKTTTASWIPTFTFPSLPNPFNILAMEFVNFLGKQSSQIIVPFSVSDKTIQNYETTLPPLQIPKSLDVIRKNSKSSKNRKNSIEKIVKNSTLKKYENIRNNPEIIQTTTTSTNEEEGPFRVSLATFNELSQTKEKFLLNDADKDKRQTVEKNLRETINCPRENEVRFQLFPKICQIDDDCNEWNGGNLCCDIFGVKSCTIGIPKPLEETKHSRVIQRKCPKRPLAELWWKIEVCETDRDCWPRVCCPDGQKRYCRTSQPKLEMAPVPVTVQRSINYLTDYLECTAPPPAIFDLHPKTCTSTFDCFPNVCCQEAGLRHCRPPKKSILTMLANVFNVDFIKRITQNLIIK